MIPVPPLPPKSSTDWYPHYAGMDASLRDAQTDITARQTIKNIEDRTRSIYAVNPSPESGLLAIAADAATDDAPRIRAILSYIKSTYGGGSLIMPPGKTSNVNSAITIPAGVQVIGDGKSRWDFWYAPDGITAVTINDSDFMPINGLVITGKQWDANASTANVTTSTGLRITGSGLKFQELRVSGFNTGIDLTGDHTYIINFHHSSVVGCKIGINVDLSNEWSGRAGGSNDSGELITFSDSLIANNGDAFWASGNGCDLHFVNTSIDSNNTYGRVNVARVYSVSSHFEGTYNGTGTGHSWMFDLMSNARMTFVACDFIHGGTAATHIVDPAPGPWNYGGGYVKFVGCDGYAQRTAAATTANAVVAGQSDAMIGFPEGTTSQVIYSPFISKYSRTSVKVVATDGNAQANLSARITNINVAAATVTVTLSAPATAGTFVELSF